MSLILSVLSNDMGRPGAVEGKRLATSKGAEGQPGAAFPDENSDTA
jgi:hypothetical protein